MAKCRHDVSEDCPACADAEIEYLRSVLVQIRMVCRDNAPETCNHRMALDFVRQLTAAAIPPSDRETP